MDQQTLQLLRELSQNVGKLTVALGPLVPSTPYQGVITAIQQLVKATWGVQVAINDKFPDWVTAPVTTADPGTAGQVAYDGTHFFVCVAPNSWGRVLLDFAF